jgi:predicted transport protein
LIFEQSGELLKTVSRIDFKSEKELQTLIEGNLEEVFGCTFVDTEFSTGSLHGGRIDTLAISEDGNPVIIEYKKEERSNLVNQGLFYLDWIKDHKGDFEVAVKKRIPNAEIDWSHIRVICIAPSFDRYSLHAVRHMGGGLELWQYHRYANGILELEEIFRSVESGKAKSTEKTDKSSSSKEEHNVDSLKAKGNPDVQKLFEKASEFLLGLNESVVAVPQKYYIAFKFAKNIACIEIQKSQLRIWLPNSHRPDMPSFARDVTNIGHYGTGNLELAIHTEGELDLALPILKETYLLKGGD